jgi:hypothetical protein
MPIRVQCGNAGCKKALRVSDEYAGKRVKCPGCGQPIAVPAQADSAEAVSASPPKAPSTRAVSASPAKAPVKSRTKKGEREFTAYCLLDDANLNLKFDAGIIRDRLRRQVDKNLGKKKVVLSWQDEEEDADVQIRFVLIDQGNQFLRWFIPGIAPAVVEIEGEVGTDGKNVHSFNYIRKAHIGIFGGSGKYMLRVCADRLARDVTREVLRLVK